MRSTARDIRKEMMFDHINCWAESGKSRRVYCKEANLALSVFAYWQTKFRKAQLAPPSFVSLKAESGKLSEAGIELQYPNGVRLIWRGETNPAIIKALISLY